MPQDLKNLKTSAVLTITISAALLATGLAACKKKPFVANTSAYILGPVSNIMTVTPDMLPQINPQAMAGSVLISTVLSSTEVKFCSGSLIASDVPNGYYRVLANHHCYAVEDDQGIATPQLLPQACVNTKVYLGFIQGMTQDSTVVGCTPGSLRTTFDGDLSVFRLNGPVPAKYQPLQVASSDLVPDGRQALIVHYPDIGSAMMEPPDGGPELPTAQVTLANCKVIGGFPIGDWQYDKSLPYSIKHTCDLTHGSSGSGLIDAVTGQILGVDWGGIQINNSSGSETDNVATRASFVQAFLASDQAQLEQTAATELAQASTNGNNGSKSGVQVSGAIQKGSCGSVGTGGAAGAWWLLWGGPLCWLYIPEVATRGRWRWRFRL